MIQAIIILLVVILFALITDWSRIIKKGPVSRWLHLKGEAKKSRPKTKLLSVSEKKGTSFNFDLTPEESVAVEQHPVEEETSSYQPTSEVQDLLNEADVHFRKGEMKAAEKFYIQAAAKDPRCSKAYSRLGIIYLENGDNWEDAEAAFRQALKTDLSNGFILNNLGLVLYHQDKYADAIRHFEKAVRQDEFNPARHANLGMAYMAMRQYAKAESSFKKALKLAPNEMEYKDLLNESIEKKKAHKTMVRH